MPHRGAHEPLFIVIRLSNPSLGLDFTLMTVSEPLQKLRTKLLTVSKWCPIRAWGSAE
jgi:hypothetical protein